MVLKFNDFINEGLWSKSLNRGRTGDVRLENKLPEGVYRVNNFPDYSFTLDLVNWEFFDEDDLNIYVNIHGVPFDEDMMLASIHYPFEEGECPQFDKTFYDENMAIQAKGHSDMINVIESDKFRKSFNETLLSLPKDTWTKKYFEEFINEGLWSKSLNRGRTGEKRLEDNDMTPDERECYKLLKEWCRGGQFNVEKENNHQRFSFDQDFEQFQKNLYDGLSKLDCCKLLIDIPQYTRSKFLITNNLNNGWGGVIFTPSFQNKMRNEIYMFVMDETVDFIDYYSISTHYYDEDNVDIIRRKLKDLVLPNMDSPHGVYIAYRVPEKVMLKVMKENKI